MADISEATRARVALLWPDVLAKIAAGALVSDTLKAAGVTDKEKRGYLANNPEARAQWDEAREASADAYHEEALMVARGASPDFLDAAGDARPKDADYDRRVHVDTLKWAARTRNPRVYGEKAQLDVNVRTVDLTRIIQDANARLAASQARVIGSGSIVPARADVELIESMLGRKMLDGGTGGG